MKKCLYQIIDIHEEDTYYKYIDDLIGIVGTFSHHKETRLYNYFSGSFKPLKIFSFGQYLTKRFKRNSYIYFWKVKIKKLS